ncbi:MAG: tripartite tricarboxylate transporter substrate binding protein [Hyphomicrobiales bacterium]|nr:tripartite tricarboxylate transporter substrate binding protein [Hyphomicrobiales bacterium]
MMPRERISGFTCPTISSWAALLLLAAPLAAEEFPTRPIKIVSPHPPGVATDVIGRALASRLGDPLGQPVVLENRPGANGIVAAGQIAKAEPDAYTILITSGAHIANAFVTKSLPFDVLNDFSPVTQLTASYGLALITNLPVNSVPELVALAKKTPGKLTYATNGVGNITHIAGLLFDARAGTKMTPVPYNTPNLTTDVMTGTVDLAFYSMAAAAPLVNAGKIKALALTGSRRSPTLPATPTLQELGFKNFDITGWFGLLVPKGTPADRITRIYDEARKALATPELERANQAAAMYAVASKPTEFEQFLKNDYSYQDRLMEELGLKVK